MADRVYVIAGRDEPLVNARCQELVDELLDPQQRLTALLSADGDEASISDILDELRTAPFLADKRVVVVKGADDFISKYRSILERYFEKPAPTGILILTVSSWDGRTKLAKMLSKVGTLVQFQEPKRWELPGLLVQHAADKHKVKLNRDAAELLTDLAGEELAHLYSEIDKLTLFARGEKTITLQHVESLIGHHRIYDAFEVLDAVTAGNTAQAVKRLRNMFEEDKDAEYTAVGAFAFHVRRMFQAKAMLEKRASLKDVADRLHVWYNKDRFFSQIQRLTLVQIAALLDELATIDYATKTGQAQAPVAIEQLVLKLVGKTHI
jgi:DNA polymerase-3 subunit delta